MVNRYILDADTHATPDDRALDQSREGIVDDVGVCLNEIEAVLQGSWETSTRLEVHSEAGLPPVRCDHVGLQTALLNLLFNAHDAMPDGGLISIHASAVLQNTTQSLIEFRVADSGIGMTQETMVRAFDPFFTTKAKGLGGVGLPTVKRFSDQFGGSVDIESIQGSGTTVILRLPAAVTGTPGR